MRGVSIIVFLYELIGAITFVILSYWDWFKADSFINFLFRVIINGITAAFWPLYWGILHWMS